jgi:ribosomal protein S18 acetylase RimI-like enzyme
MFDELSDLQAPWRVFPLRPSVRADVARNYAAALDDRDALLVVAEDGAEIVGMAAGHVVRPSTFSDQPAVELSNVYVRPEHRRKGVARALTSAVARFARDRGVPRITLRTFAQNDGALEAWRRLGFEPRAVQLTAAVEDLAT